MIKRKIVYVVMAFFSLSWPLSADNPDVYLIPKPQKIVVTENRITIEDIQFINTHSNSSIESIITYAGELFEGVFQNRTSPKKNIYLQLKPVKSETISRYHISANPKEIQIDANTAEGLFHAVQTLYQILIHGEKTEKGVTIPCLEISDFPRFQYRGMHQDVGRHFKPVDFIKKYIDYLALFKFNRFHWHLTEDQGWRIEIKRYPKLTEIGSKRKETMVEKNFEPYIGDGIPCGGFYTQEEIKAVVKYAQERFITIIPEIEMPGHSSAALAAYPGCGCTGGPYEVKTKWGIFDDVYCAGKDQTFEFLQNILDEVIELFPSKYIHIGGDECPKASWKKCPDCQKRIQEEGLKDEFELQSYFIKRIEKYLNAKGRQIIGWDEILEGGLAPEATVMSWRGFEGGIEAAKQGHHVVMTPTDYCYFDYYQGDRDIEPLAIGGYLPLSKVYQFDPVPEGFTKEQAAYVLGGQANVWTEYIKTPQHVEYMIFPRMLAMSEVLWSNKESRNFKDFVARCEKFFPYFESKNINYAKSIYQVSIQSEIAHEKNQLKIILGSELKVGELYYSTDGSEPVFSSRRYSEPFLLEKSATIKSRQLSEKIQSGISTQDFLVHKAIGKKVQLLETENEINYGDAYCLVDGRLGQHAYWEGNWQGVAGDDFIALIDLETPNEIKEISIRFLQYRYRSDRIYLPKEIKIYGSTDGRDFNTLGTMQRKNKLDSDETGIQEYTLTVKRNDIRFLKINTKNIGIGPSDGPDAGEPARMLADEIIIN